MNERWSRPKGPELEENKRALRGMRAIFWMFVLGALCLSLYFGLFIAWQVYGGG